MTRIAMVLLALATALPAWSQVVTEPAWRAMWITTPDAAPQDYGVYHFRRTFELPAKPAKFMVRVSGDNRYILFANGSRVSWGPARADLTHWRYETVDIAPQLHAGKNVLAAVVWNDGPERALAQVSNQTGFLLSAENNEALDSNKQWKCIRDKAYSPQPLPHDQSTGYYALGPNEKVDGAAHPWGWESADFDDSSWPAAKEITRAASRYSRDAPNRWMLVASAIPLEEQKREDPLNVRSGQSLPLAVPAHASATLLLDQGHLTTAYPELSVQGGRGATVDLKYAEAFYLAKGQKGNRNEITGQFYGPSDTYVADGAERIYRPLYWRTYRYIQLTVKTADEPLTVRGLASEFSGYPFERRASLQIDDPKLNKELEQILTTGWRTARLCAHETYVDCPYYEQLQYAGDARIQMMISLYMTGDARLMKNGIALINDSRTAEGATYSRAPSALPQYIPPFSLWWIGMVHDYWMYVDDADFVKEMLPGVRAVLSFYSRYQKATGSLQRMPWWNFVDWVKQWPNGEPPADADGSSAAALDLQLLAAYDWAADLEKVMGSQALAGEYGMAASRVRRTLVATDWVEARGLFADQPSHRTFSQQVNTLAVLAHLLPDKSRGIMQKVMTDAGLAQSSIYFRAYTNAGLREVGLGDQYLAALEPWRHMLQQGLTTWAEWDAPDTRSDCHAWGASPNFELFRTMVGVESAAPGYKRVRVTPNPGTIRQISASVPHPNGDIHIDLRQDGGKLAANVELPAGTTGEFVWAGKTQEMKPGKNHLQF